MAIVRMAGNAQATLSLPPAPAPPPLSALHDLSFQPSPGSAPDHRGTERTGILPSVQLTGWETISVSREHLSPSFRPLPCMSPCFVSQHRRSSNPAREWGLLLDRSYLRGNQGELHGGGDIWIGSQKMDRISSCKVRSGFKPTALHRIILWPVTSPSLGVLIWQMGEMMAGLFRKRR